MTTLVLNPKKEKEENTIVKNWSKGTKPLVSLQASDTQHASSKEGLLSLVLKKRPDDEASRDFLLRMVQPGLSGLMDGHLWFI